MTLRGTLRAALVRVLWLLVPVAPAAAFAQDAGGPPLAVRANVQWIGAAMAATPAETWLNPANGVLGIPQATWLGEARGDIRVSRGDRLRLVLRPRVRASAEGTRAGDLARAWNHEATFEMTEAYLAWRPSDSVGVTYGLQNFQWGPSELMSPSNRLFHEIGVFRDPLYSVRGKHLLRLNLSAGRQWSLVALGELGARCDAPFRGGAPCRRGAQAKVEYTTASGAHYVGLTAGVRGGEPPWAGGYAAFELPAGVSLYADFSVQQGSQAWYPVDGAAGRLAFDTSDRRGELRGLALGGVRYTHSGSFDARLEVLGHGAGYTRAQVSVAPLAVAADPSPESVARWLNPGLEFLGRSVVLVALSGHDLLAADRVDVLARYVGSLTDRSGAAFATTTVDLAGAVVAFGSLLVTHGGELTEFARLAGAAAVAGLIWSW